MADLSNGFGMGNTTGQGFGMSGGRSNDDWKSDFFVNLMLPGVDGKPKKFGAVGLKLSNKRQKALIEMFQKDPEGTAKKLLAKMTIEFRPAEQGDGDAFDL